jgi:hypothetical protein
MGKKRAVARRITDGVHPPMVDSYINPVQSIFLCTQKNHLEQFILSHWHTLAVS